MSKILVTAKVNPDLDGTSCTLAYAELLKRQGKDAEGLVSGEPQSEARYFIDKQGIKIPQREDMLSNEWDTFILVDASSMKGMPKCVSAEDVLEVIDHRKGESEKEFPKAKIQNELIGAAATIVIERYKQVKEKPLPEHAKLLYGAIFHNTLNFIATISSERDKEAIKFLENEFNLDKNIIREMFDYATKEIEGDIALALENDAKEFGTGWKIGAYQLIVWGDGILKDKDYIKRCVKDLASKMDATWSFLNLINLESTESVLFATNDEAEKILSRALDTKFDNGIAVLSHAMLRKQIMPKVNEIVAKLA